MFFTDLNENRGYTATFKVAKDAAMRADNSFVRFESEKVYFFPPNVRCLCVLKAQRMTQYRKKDSK